MLYKQSERMVATVDVQPSMPRNCANQRQRLNADAENTKNRYRINVAIPFMDHILHNFQLWLKLHQNSLVWFLQFCAKGR